MNDKNDETQCGQGFPDTIKKQYRSAARWQLR